MKPLAKSAAFIGWMMMLYEIYTVTKAWQAAAATWDLTPMGDSDADKVWQKEMKRITAGLTGSALGGIAGSMVGTMILPGAGTLVGGLTGGVLGYFGGEAAFNATQTEDRPTTKPTERFKTGDVGGDEAAMAAFGPQHDNITIISQNNNDNRQNQVTEQSAVTTVNTGGFGGGKQRYGLTHKRTSTGLGGGGSRFD